MSRRIIMVGGDEMEYEESSRNKGRGKTKEKVGAIEM